jgi:hypothetical protein
MGQLTLKRLGKRPARMGFRNSPIHPKINPVAKATWAVLISVYKIQSPSLAHRREYLAESLLQI